MSQLLSMFSAPFIASYLVPLYRSLSSRGRVVLVGRSNGGGARRGDVRRDLGRRWQGSPESPQGRREREGDRSSADEDGNLILIFNMFDVISIR